MAFIYGLLVSLYVFVCILLVLIIMIQKGKSSMGLGSLGGGTQMLFGGSGGQDIFQKITWVLGAIFIAGSLGLSIMRTKLSQEFRYVKPVAAQIQHAQPAPQPSNGQ